jgi:hypothetical protein
MHLSRMSTQHSAQGPVAGLDNADMSMFPMVPTWVSISAYMCTSCIYIPSMLYTGPDPLIRHIRDSRHRPTATYYLQFVRTPMSPVLILSN